MGKRLGFRFLDHLRKHSSMILLLPVGWYFVKVWCLSGLSQPFPCYCILKQQFCSTIICSLIFLSTLTGRQKESIGISCGRAQLLLLPICLLYIIVACKGLAQSDRCHDLTEYGRRVAVKQQLFTVCKMPNAQHFFASFHLLSSTTVSELFYFCGCPKEIQIMAVSVGGD